MVIESCITSGGPVPTALRVVTRFGGTAMFCGKVGDDEEGRQIIRELDDDKVDTRQIVVDKQATTSHADIWIDPTDGSRTIALNTPENPWITAEQFTADSIRDCRVFFTDGRAIEASMLGLKTARKAGISTVFDAGSSRPGLYEMLPLIDYAIVSQDLGEHLDLGKLSLANHNISNSAIPLALANHLINSGAKTVIVTLGERGALWHDGNNKYVYPTFPIDAFDTTGAGDVFHGAFIHGLLQNWEVSRIITFANAAAALSCRRLSGSGGIPTLGEVEKLLQNSPV